MFTSHQIFRSFIHFNYFLHSSIDRKMSNTLTLLLLHEQWSREHSNISLLEINKQYVLNNMKILKPRSRRCHVDDSYQSRCLTASLNVAHLFLNGSSKPRATQLTQHLRDYANSTFNSCGGEEKSLTSKPTIIPAVCIRGNGIWGLNLDAGSGPAHLARARTNSKQHLLRLSHKPEINKQLSAACIRALWLQLCPASSKEESDGRALGSAPRQRRRRSEYQTKECWIWRMHVKDKRRGSYRDGEEKEKT